tara:strand:+ start:112 stop:339 length:228 start_codon:yes stop_codon:yes gene_type:complete
MVSSFQAQTTRVIATMQLVLHLSMILMTQLLDLGKIKHMVALKWLTNNNYKICVMEVPKPKIALKGFRFSKILKK